MGFDVRVSGGDDLRRVQQRLREVGDKGLGKQMGKAIRRAVAPLRPAVVAEAGKVMPEGGGYRAVLVGSLRVRTQIRETRWSADVTVRVYGDGKTERRDIPRLNRGQLRHPNPPGRFRRRKWTVTKPRKRIPGGQVVRNDWSTTKIRSGFVDRPADRLGPDMTRQIRAVVDAVAGQIGA
jgi:hypothetical protein